MAGVDGKYQFRFAGYARAGGARPFHIIGVGYMTLTNGKDIGGFQWSTRMPMQGVSDALAHSAWKLSGGYVVNGDGSMSVSVNFTPDGTGTVVMKDVFRLVPSNASGDAFWLISTGPTDMSNNRLDELVSGEAVKVA